MYIHKSTDAVGAYNTLLQSLFGLYGSRPNKYVEMCDVNGAFFTFTYKDDEALRARVAPKKSIIFARGEDENIYVHTTTMHKLDKDYGTALEKFRVFCEALSTTTNNVLVCWGKQFVGPLSCITAHRTSVALLETDKRLNNYATGNATNPSPTIAHITAAFVAGDNPTVEFYADMVDVFLERKSSERVGKWFAGNGLPFGSAHIDALVGSLKPTTVFFTKDGNEVAEMYTRLRTGSDSVAACMNKTKAELHGMKTTLSDHPTKMYERDISMAYITENGKPEGRVIARCLVVQKKKIFTRGYGDANRLNMALQGMGYTGSHDFFGIEVGLAVSRLPGTPFGFVSPYFDFAMAYIHIFRDPDGSWGAYLHKSSGDSKPKVEGRVYADDTIQLERRTYMYPVFEADGSGKFRIVKSGGIGVILMHAIIDADGETYLYSGAPKLDALEGALPVRSVGPNGFLRPPTFVTSAALSAPKDKTKWGFVVHDGKLILFNPDMKVSNSVDETFRVAREWSASEGRVLNVEAIPVNIMGETVTVNIPKDHVLYDVSSDGTITPVGTVYGKKGIIRHQGKAFARAECVNAFVREEFVTIMKRTLGTRIKLPEKVSGVITNLDPIIGMNISAEMPALNGKAIGERIAAVMAAVPELRVAFRTMTEEQQGVSK